MANLKPINQEFLTEAEEIMSRIGTIISELHLGNTSEEKFTSFFRGVHAVRSSAVFLKYKRLIALLAIQEEVLEAIIEKRAKLDVSSQIDCLEEGYLRVRSILSDIQQNGLESKGDDSTLIKKIGQFLDT